jgi:hypothetical protein
MMHTDEDSAALAESARILRSRSNSQVPISRLPDEILLIIFKYVEEETRLSVIDDGDGDGDGDSDESDYDDDDDFEDDDVPACLAVTHVCGRWRIVALECPTLWRFIGFNSTSWLDVMLERSQQVPLVVNCHPFRFMLAERLEKILLHLPRIEYLEFHAISRDADRIMELLSSQPAPMLETFKIAFSGMLSPTESTTNTIFQGEAPLLRSLQVINCGRRWTSCTFDGLRTLCVGTTQLSDLLTTLQRTPSLEQLTFMGGLLPSNQPIPINSKVPLARLKNLALEGTWSQDAVLLRHLDLPVDIKISIRHLSSEGLQPIVDLLSVMDRHPYESGPVFRSLRAVQSEPDCYSVQFSTSTTINVCDDLWNPQDDDIRLTIEFDYCEDVINESDAADPRDLVFGMCNIIAQRKPQTSFAGQFEFIHVEGCPGFIRCLTAALQIVEGSPQVPYPSLRVLRLQGIPFEGDELQDLVDVLTMRVQKDVPVKELCLRLCTNLSADQVDLCREVVEVVSEF